MEAVDQAKITILVIDDAGYDTRFYGEFGLSLIIDVLKNGESIRILMDTGYTPEPLLHNMKILDIPPDSIDYIFLSHCHYDHTGGLGGITEKTRKGIPVIAHPEIFRKCYILKQNNRYIGIPERSSKQVIEKNGGKWILQSQPFEFMPGVSTTGEIKRVTSYEPLEDVHVRVNDRMVQDPELDDVSLFINVADRGLLVISGCSHAGIVNIMKQARTLSGVQKIIGVIGGFHLRIAGEEQMKNTIDELTKVEKVFTGHCTGFDAMKQISDRMGERFGLLHCGTEIVFDSE